MGRLYDTTVKECNILDSSGRSGCLKFDLYNENNDGHTWCASLCIQSSTVQWTVLTSSSVSSQKKSFRE